MTDLFKWRHYESEIILTCVRWYLRYALSYRDLEELMTERGLSVDHSTIFRWVQRYAPELDERSRPHLGQADEVDPRLGGGPEATFHAFEVGSHVTAANVDGPDSPLYGKGGWTWYTGSSAWVYRVLMESIMGVRPTWEGLLIEPCIPSHWRGFKMTRRYRDHVYHIEVTRLTPDGLSVDSVTLDGQTLQANTLPPPTGPFAEHTVKVVLK
jgi:hypothetical protein